MSISAIVAALRRRLAPVAHARWLLAAAVLCLGGCSTHPYFSFLDPQGPVAAAERTHFYWVLGILVVLVAGPIFVAMPFILWRYRYGNKKARYTPKWKFARWIEIVSWGGPIIIVCILGLLVWQSAHKLDPYKPIASNQPALQVQVIGYDWKWLFIYPKLGIATIGTLGMPVGRPVAMHLTSATVMQSFFIPSLGGQIYAMGGMVTRLHLEASRAGSFLGENTMYNGNGFHHQKFRAVAMSPAAFKAWVRTVRTTGVRLDRSVFHAITQRSTREQLVAQLPPAAAHHASAHGDSVYLTGVTAQLFPAVVKATMRGTGVVLAHGSVPAHAGSALKPGLASIKEHTP